MLHNDRLKKGMRIFVAMAVVAMLGCLFWFVFYISQPDEIKLLHFNIFFSD